MAVNFVSPLSRSLLSLLDPSTNPAGRPGRPPTDSYSAFAPNLSTPSPLYGADGPFSDGTYRNPLKNPDIRALKADGPFTDGTFRDPLKNPDMQQQPLLKDPLDIISTPPYPPSRPDSELNQENPSSRRTQTSPLYGADDDADDSPVRTPPSPGVPVAGPSPLLSGGGTTEGVPVAGPAPLFPDPKVKAINDREESEHSLTKERARRRAERDALMAQKSQKAAASTSAARDRNLAGDAARKAEGRRLRPQNFNPDGSVKSPQQRVSSGTANDTDKLMALEGPARTAAFASERQKGAASQQAPQDQASSLHAAAMARYDRDARMKRMGLNPSSSIDQARFDDLVHLASR